MTDPGSLWNELARLQDVATAGMRERATAPFPEETREALAGMVGVLLRLGYTRPRAWQAVSGWVITRRPIGRVLEAVRDDGTIRDDLL